MQTKQNRKHKKNFFAQNGHNDPALHRARYFETQEA